MKKKALYPLILASLLVLVAAAGVAWLVATEAGLARAVAMLESLDKIKIRVSGASGRLIGPVRADAIDIETPRSSIRITDFEADYEPSEILVGRVSAEHVHAATAAIRLHALTEPPRLPVFMPRWLTLAIDEINVPEVTFTTRRGAELRLHDVSGSATITRTQIRFKDAAADGGSWALTGASGRALARQPLAIEGDATWSLMADRMLRGTARAHGDLSRLLVAAQIAAPGQGTADIELTSLTGAMRWVGTARIASLDVGQWTDPAPFGPLSATIKGRGNSSSYAATGLIHGDGLPSSGVTATLAAGYADRVVTVSELGLSAADSATVRMRGTMTVGEQPTYDLQADWTGFAWPLVGPAALRSSSGTLQAQGWREFNYRMNGRFRLGDLPTGEGWAAGRFTATQLIVEESSFAALGGRIEADGMLTRSSVRAWTISGRAHDIDPATLRSDLPGRLSFTLAASGSGLDQNARWTAAVSGLTGRFRGQPVSGGGTIRYQGAETQFERVALAIGPAHLQLDGRIGRKPMLDGRLVADDLGGFLPELGGHVDATLRIRGSSANLAFTGHDLAWNEHKAAVLSADARIDFDDRERSWLRLRTAGLRIAGQVLTDTRLSLDGFLRDHGVEFRVGLGEHAVELLAHGAYVDRRYTLDTHRIVAAGPRAPPYQLEAPTRLSVSADSAELAQACLIDAARRVCVDGRWQRDANWSLHAQTQSFPLEALHLRLPGRPRYSGLLSVDARIYGRAGQPGLADAKAEIRDAVVHYVAASGREQSIALGRTLLTLQSDTAHHQLNLRLVDAVAADLTAELVADRIADLSLAELPVSGRIRGSTRQLDVLPLLLDDIDHAAGNLALELAVTGRLVAPLLQGEARLTDGSMDLYQTNLRLREIHATLALRQAGLDLRATATAGRGRLDVDGRLDWEDRRVKGLLTMKGEQLLLVDVPEAHVLASPDLRFSLENRRIEVTGNVTIPEARIVPAETAGAVLVSTDERIFRAEDEPGADTSFEVSSDLRLMLGNKVDLNAYGLSGTITGTVRARSRPREAAVASGELEIADGKYRAYTRELDVERGRLLFTGGPVTDPGVDLRASRKLPGRTVGVIVRGRLRRPQLTLYSEPSLPQAQIASLLIVGQTLDSLQGDNRDNLDAERASLVAQGSALLAGQLGRYVGLDEVGVAQDEDARSALVLGKFLSPRLYLSYGISLVDEINTFKLRYTIGDRWVFSAEAGLESAADIEYRIER